MFFYDRLCQSKLKMAKSVESFTKTLVSFIEYVRDNVPDCRKAAKVVLIKAETALSMSPEMLCSQFVEELQPHVGLITSRDPAFVSDVLPTLKVIKDMKISGVWSQCSSEIQNEVWNRLNSVLMLGLAAANEINASKKSTDGVSRLSSEDIDPSELGDMMQKIMPGMMSMMGPMLQGMGGGANRKQKKKLARDAADPNSPLQKMAQGALGIDLDAKSRSKSSSSSSSGRGSGARGLI